MSFYYQSGEGFNLVARSAAVNGPTTVISGTFNPNFPMSNLYDGRPSAYAQYSDPIVAETYVAFDLNLLQGGDAEVDLDAGWYKHYDTVPVTASRTADSPTYAGAYSHLATATVAAGVHWSGWSRQLRFRAGEKLRLYWAGAKRLGDRISFIIQHQDTGKYLTSAGSWVDGYYPAGNASSESWEDGFVTFAVPPADDGGGLWQTLIFSVQGETIAAQTEIGFRWEAKIVPGWDTVVVLGHANTPLIPLRLTYCALVGENPTDGWWHGDSWTATAVSDWIKTPSEASGVFPVDEYGQSSMWNKANATRYERFVEFRFTNANILPFLRYGELILCQAETLPRAPRLQVSDAYEGTGQIRQESGAGDPWTYNRTPNPRHRITLRYQTADSPVMPGPSADERAIRSMFSTRTHAGLWPVLVIPHGSHDSRAVIYGSTQSVFGVEHMPPERAIEVEVLEYPIPGLHPGLFSV